MRILYIIFSLFFIVSCNNKATKKGSVCNEYITTIKLNWQKNKEGFYPISDKKILWNENQKCLIGKSKKEIKQIFGEPNNKPKNLELGINSFGYYLNNGCFRGESGECVIFTLHFDNNDKVSFIPLPIIQPKDIQ